MVIGTNVTAMYAHRMLGMHTSSAQKYSQWLTTGRRINSAADDPAGMAIASKMTAQIRGLRMANRNVQDAISLIQTAEGGLGEIHSILQRLSELSVQAANGTYTDSDRKKANMEFQELLKAIDGIAGTTEFNKVKLLSGGKEASNSSELTAFTRQVSNISFEVEALEMASLELEIKEFGLEAKDTEKDTELEDIELEEVLLENLTSATSNTSSIELANLEAFTNNVENSNQMFQAITTPKSTSNTSNNSREIYIQSGANAGQGMYITLPNISTDSLGLKDTGIETEEKAQEAITKTQNAIDKVSSSRAILGAQQNRLERTSNYLDIYADNLDAALSRIVDTDMAQAMMGFVKSNILAQAATFVLAQSNKNTESLLKLLLNFN